MFHVDNSTTVLAKPPKNAVHNVVTQWFNDRIGSKPTTPQADWFNMMQSELLAVLVAAEITPNKMDDEQLIKAINVLINHSSINLWDKLKLACPVGMLGNSFDAKVFNNHWLSLNGEYISRVNYPLLYDYFIGLGYAPNAQQLIQLPDARALVMRSQNKGRFSDVTEIELSKYQSDATQKIAGHIGAVQIGQSGLPAGGAFNKSTWTGLYGQYQSLSTPTTGNGIFSQYFDNSAVARTALEERVKSIGVHAQIFIGFGDLA